MLYHAYETYHTCAHRTHRTAPRHTAPHPPHRTGGPLLTAPASPPASQVREATAPIYSGFVRLHGTAERARAERWAARQAARASLPERHGGVLALAALVSLAPYDVPCWLPALLERLAGYFNAPQPIKGVVTKAFADFKRTHQDNWAAHKERLTYEQQELISDMLISPSFYA